MAPRKNQGGGKKGKGKAPKDKKEVVPKPLVVQDASTTPTPDDSEESSEGDMARKVTVGKKPRKAKEPTKERKEKDIAVTSIPQIRDNQDMLAEWIQTNECMYNTDHQDHKDTDAILILFNQKAEDMMKEKPELGEVTGKYHDCVEFC